MKALPVILAVVMLAGCSGMRTSGESMSRSHTGSQWESGQSNTFTLDPNYQDPSRNIYFGG